MIAQPLLFPDFKAKEPEPDAISNEFYTPKWLLEWLPPIACDPCWSPNSAIPRPNHAIDFAAGGDGLTAASWFIDSARDSIVFVNPPYSDCARWVAECNARSRSARVPVIALVPAYSGDQYWHRSVWGRAAWVGFIAGRIRFDTVNGPAAGTASFTSALICWAPAPQAAWALGEILLRKARSLEADRGLWVVDAQKSLEAQCLVRK